MTLNLKSMKFSTKSLMAALTTVIGLLQVPAVSAIVLPFVQHHPHVSTIAAGLTTLYALLHNPQVASILHLDIGGTPNPPQGGTPNAS